MEGLSEIETKNKGLAKEGVVEHFPLKAAKKAPRLEIHKVAVVELPVYLSKLRLDDSQSSNTTIIHYRLERAPIKKHIYTLLYYVGLWRNNIIILCML